MDDADRGQFAKPPEDAERRRPRPSLLPIATVLGSGVGLVLVVFSCAGVPGLLLLAAIGGIGGFIGLQYLIWGWWLGERIRREEAAAGDRGDLEE